MQCQTFTEKGTKCKNRAVVPKHEGNGKGGNQDKVALGTYLENYAMEELEKLELLTLAPEVTTNIMQREQQEQQREEVALTRN